MNRSINWISFYLLIFLVPFRLFSIVTVGADTLFENQDYAQLLKGKRIGLLTNHTAINQDRLTTYDLMKKNASKYQYKITALFSPEHGFYGLATAEESVDHSKNSDGIPIFSLHGETKRPTKAMLSQIDVLVYDIQDIGARSYTYVTTLLYAMEEVTKQQIPILVLDRPNPINGVMIDGPCLEKKWRSFVGYINVPYCHGMTVGELALFFKGENLPACDLTVIPMKNWKRTMTFQETGLSWVPTSPHIPEASTVFYYPLTGQLGELQLINIGVGYTLPFKILGAPWIDAERLASALNAKNFEGIHFRPFHFKPFYGRFAKEDCHGVQIIITDPLSYKPVSTQLMMINVLKQLYPENFNKAVEASASRKEMFCKVNGTEKIYQALRETGDILQPLKNLHAEEHKKFLKLRQKYLMYGA